MQEQSMNRIQATLEAFNSIGVTSEGMQRLAYTFEEKQVQDLFAEFCSKEGMSVRVDEVGNVIARREGSIKDAPAIAIGSHLDTVYNGGKYDGTAGIVAGLEVIRRLNDSRIETEYPIEVICFVSEESSRFGISTIGSKAMAGELSRQSIAKVTDKKGVYLTDAMKNSGYQIEKLAKAKRYKDELRAFIELHIEQGPELEQQNKQIAIATGIAAPTRLNVLVKGMASHSGTTSMEHRKDALVAAAKQIVTIEEAAKKEMKYKTVATVGIFDVFPGAMNVVPDSVLYKVDIRGLDMQSKKRIISKLDKKIKQLEQDKGIVTTTEILSDETPILLDKDIQQVLELACEDLSIEPLSMPSGAGHDAMNMQLICPTGLIFIPSQKGISHNPAEYTPLSDIVRGVDVLEKSVLRLASVKEGKVQK
ncbi:M20 family metallo-hydrolase [Aquibacillus saliphilus]|uniref:M20 family metallo-hydrolase n=1 Tax=Aquibacillus saliphilus TaxID=1909422 RepID=UPI001CF0BAF5|nr:M20 family metallo-hydrolase [Aquibacillus saliphilus]